MSETERAVSCESEGSSEAGNQSPEAMLASIETSHPHDLDLLAKMEEANRKLQISSPTDLEPKECLKTAAECPSQLDLLAKLEQANRLLEADKRSRNALTPTHSRSGSTAGTATMSSGGQSHSRKGSSTSMISTTSNNSQVTEEETTSPEKNLWEIWGKIVNDWASAKKKPAFIRQLVRKGIPHPFRGLAWQLLLDVNNSPMKDQYVDFLKQKSPSEKMIRRDIARTFPEHDFFKEKDGLGQESLFHVMKAYSLVDREVGYCQGSGFIVGLLLMQMPEEEAFAVLVKLMQDYRLRELFKPSMAELGLCMYKLECLIQELLPDLYTHFQTQSFHTSMYASSWFLTLFATVVPLAIACRIMDLFISEGMDVIFRVGIAILQSSQSDLLSMDMEAMLQFFQKDIAAKFERDEEILFNMSYHVRINAKRFKRLEKEYTALKSKENEDQIELRRLRTENRLLRQRIDSLEKESATLADRLIQYQLTRAQEAEETYALKNELSLTKQKYTHSQKQLKEAESLLGDIKERTDSINSASTLDEGEAQMVIQGLQEELIMVRLKEAENMTTVKNLRQKIDDLQQLNARIQQAPSNDIQCLQEELIAVKLREAEANLSLKEMRQTIAELDASWQLHMSSNNEPISPKDRGSKKELKTELKKAQEELMSAKLKEAAVLSHLKDTKQKVMELETSNQICSNQIRRMDEENKKLKGEIDERGKQEAELQKQIKSLLRKMDDLDTKRREEGMMARIREAESDQMIGELKQKIAATEIQKEEVLAADRLDAKGGKQDLENTIFDLQEEVLQLKMSASPKSPIPPGSSASAHINNSKSAFDDDFDDEEDIEDPESLNRTLSEIIEGKRSSTSLIAYLNRENSDCDSQSGSSESSASGQRLVTRGVMKDIDISIPENSETVDKFEDIPLDKDTDNSGAADKGEHSAIQTHDSDKLNTDLNQSGTGAVTGSQVKNGSVLVTQSGTGSISQRETENGAIKINLPQTGSVVGSQHDTDNGAILANQSPMQTKTVVNGDIDSVAERLVDSNENISIGEVRHKSFDAKPKPDISTA